MATGKFRLNEEQQLEIAKPVDFSFQSVTALEAIGVEGARQSRIGSIPERGSEHRKYLTRSVWLNNNKLTSIENMDLMVNSILEQPQKLGWIDFSFNYIEGIHDVILKFPNLKIIYFHGNQITELDEVVKLRNLKFLRSVTFHGNPIAELPRYRNYVISALPQIVNLDFCPIVKTERFFPMPPDLARKIQSLEEMSGQGDKES